MLKYHKKKLVFPKNVLHKESTVPEQLIFLLLLPHFIQKFSTIFFSLQHWYPCKNWKGNQNQMHIFKTTQMHISNSDQHNTPHFLDGTASAKTLKKISNPINWT